MQVNAGKPVNLCSDCLPRFEQARLRPFDGSNSPGSSQLTKEAFQVKELRAETGASRHVKNCEMSVVVELQLVNVGGRGPLGSTLKYPDSQCSTEPSRKVEDISGRGA